MEDLLATISESTVSELEDYNNQDFMPKKQVNIVKKLEPRKKNGCRGLHYSCHSPTVETEFCKNCDGYVQLKNKNTCSCCEKEVVRFLKHTWLNRVLKFGIRQHKNFINDWVRFPDQGVHYEKLVKPYTWYQEERDPKTFELILDQKTGNPKLKKITVEEGYSKKPRRSQMLEIKYRDTVYEIEVKYLALALETLDATDDNAKFRDKKLEIINRHIGIKGLRIWIPDGEIMDTKCTICSSFLRYDKNDNFFCPKCGKSEMLYD